MAPEAEPRNYHSVAVLLPDGRVFSGGGGLCGILYDQPSRRADLLSPPYLFNSDGSLRTRPDITSAPTSAATGDTITVTTGGPVSSFSMVRYGESTHSVDNDQRRIPLQIVSLERRHLPARHPLRPRQSPCPGPYMLFAIDANGHAEHLSQPSYHQCRQPRRPPTATARRSSPTARRSYWPLNDATGPTASRPERQRATRQLLCHR